MVGTWKSGNREEKDYGLLLYLKPELLFAHSRLVTEKRIARHPAGLLIFTEGCKALGLINEETYQMFREFYSRETPKSNLPHKKIEVLTPEQKAEKLDLEQRDQFFKEVLKQWDLHPELEWQVKMFTIAKKYQDKLESARDILAKDTREPKVEEAI